MEFRTQIPITPSSLAIDYNSQILSLGSCFAENISQKFNYFKFQNTVNPFGIIFNPISIEKLIQRSIRKDYFTDKDVFFHNDLWHCFEVHSELSNPDKEALIQRLNGLLNEFYFQISQLTHCLITFGTSWVYRNIETDQIVANCHKVPQKQFTKELLSVDTIAESIQNSIDFIQSINPKVNFTFTVSPVRHIKDGYVENTLSKAHLTAAIHKIVNSNIQIPNSNSEILNPKSQILHYFPSYEIMMDELRDYRFYNPDMLHPNSVAIDYIWERFVTSSIAEKALTTMKEVASIQSGLQHRPFNPDSEAHQLFLSKLQGRISLLQKQFPEIQF